ncbi:ABC transporter G family member 28 [Dorcoceras hygrometricum]|uniref:ABC transporter G family member 28 n=1 Tax=Dorcoceras hygrometricum TaxID=472368 RepID=A0A2Z7BMH4_9LAMI|nr:ABC transporter G family member 28 [Dorcoceras hygrometricum]
MTSSMGTEIEKRQDATKKEQNSRDGRKLYHREFIAGTQPWSKANSPLDPHVEDIKKLREEVSRLREEMGLGPTTSSLGCPFLNRSTGRRDPSAFQVPYCERVKRKETYNDHIFGIANYNKLKVRIQ